MVMFARAMSRSLELMRGDAHCRFHRIGCPHNRMKLQLRKTALEVGQVAFAPRSKAAPFCDEICCHLCLNLSQGMVAITAITNSACLISSEMPQVQVSELVSQRHKPGRR